MRRPAGLLIPAVRLTLPAVVALLAAWSLLIPDVYPRFGDPGPWEVARSAALGFSGLVTAWAAIEIWHLRRRRAATSTVVAIVVIAATIATLGIGLLYFVALALGAAPERG